MKRWTVLVSVAWVLACVGEPAQPPPSPASPPTPPPSPSPSNEPVAVLAIGPRAVAVQRRATGDIDCSYPGLPPKVGVRYELHWVSGLVEEFPVYRASFNPPSGEGSPMDSNCVAPAESARLETLVDTEFARAGLDRSGATTWYDMPTPGTVVLPGGQEVLLDIIVSLNPSDPDPDEMAPEEKHTVALVDGVTVAARSWLRSSSSVSLGSYPIGIAVQGPSAAAVFGLGLGGEDDALWVGVFDPSHPTPVTTVSPAFPGTFSLSGPVEIQGLDLSRNLVAYRRFTPSTGATCDYPKTPGSGVILGILNVVNHTREEWVVYETPGTGACTQDALASERLAAAKARSKDLGLDRVTGEFTACQLIRTGDRTPFRLAGVAEPGIWSGSDGMVCLDDGYVLFAAIHEDKSWWPDAPFKGTP